MSFVDRLNDVPPLSPDDYVRFVVDGVRLGMMTESFASNLLEFPDVFVAKEKGVALNPAIQGHEERTRTVASVLSRLHDRGIIPGWRDEMYPVATDYHQPSLFHIERAASPLFGIRIYAVNLNGYVRVGGETKVWIARRSATKQTSPGKLDVVVSGGHPAGVTLRDNLVKECGEEANIPVELAEQARPVGGISFLTPQPNGVLHYLQFSYDLELPPDFTPANTDGEVAEFSLWTINDLRERVETTDDFAPDSALVVIDMLMRHGFIEADHPEYPDLLRGLRR